LSIAFGQPSSSCWQPNLDRFQQILLRQAIRANVRFAVNALRHGSEFLEQLVLNDQLIVGGEYMLETGVVDFFDELPKAESVSPR
jgi:hypothetical protein